MINFLRNYENTGGSQAASNNAFSDDYGASDAANPESPNFGTKSYGNVARNENSYESDVFDGDL
jgi:hypothetical protein